ncbi:glycoside hydrolase family 2 TIM barrel-domain containing protein [Mariniflexile sp.]|uniref:glycoside hydrolase family 2 TIM barrel-domain containing protein n=1 Tax=Mariniflexile sp. TaxID=1979402 RepID=UPI00356B4925
MVKTNKNILRSILILSYLAVIAFLVFGASAIFSYLNTGADRSKMLHTEIKKEAKYLPKIVWDSISNEGRPMDLQTLNSLEKDYLDAWYVKHICYLTNTTTGLEDYYTENARKNLFSFIEANKKEGIHIEATTLEHHPNLDFFSEDGQLAVLTDTNVVEYKTLYKKDSLAFETIEISNYKVTLLLEDGFWRIRHLVKEHSENYQDKGEPIDVSNINIKGINYYPQNTPWDMFGEAFSIKTILNDFRIIKNAGLNTIRIFIQYEDFGKGNVKPEKLEKLKKVLDLAEAEQLKVVVTLFDFYGDYSVLDYTINQRHAETIVSTFKNHNAIIAWDIKNEPNLDFDSRGKNKVLAWLKHMINLVKSIDKTHAVTIGWSNAESATILKNELDFVSFHYYENLDNLDTTYKNLKSMITDKPVVLGEFGLSSYSGIWNFYGESEKTQAEYYKKAQHIISKNNIPFMSWTLYDFNKIPKEVVGRLPWRKRTQEHFGFINQKGETKPAFKYISKL